MAMRETTIKKYSTGIQLIAGKSIKHDDLVNVSREYFGNFVFMHYLRKSGCLIEVSKGAYKLDETLPPSVVLERFRRLQQEAGIKAAKRHKQKLKLAKQQTVISDNHQPNKDVINYVHGGEIKSQENKAQYHVDKLRDMGYTVVCTKTIEL